MPTAQRMGKIILVSSSKKLKIDSKISTRLKLNEHIAQVKANVFRRMNAFQSFSNK